MSNTRIKRLAQLIATCGGLVVVERALAVFLGIA